MKFIKHNNRRVNLAVVSSYKGVGSNEIEFYCAKEVITWIFGGHSKRDAMLKKLDEIVDMAEVETKKAEPGEVNVTVL